MGGKALPCLGLSGVVLVPLETLTFCSTVKMDRSSCRAQPPCQVTSCLYRVEPQQKVLGGEISYLRYRGVMPLNACIFRSTVKMDLSPGTAKTQDYLSPLIMRMRSACLCLLVLDIGSSADPLGHLHHQQSYDNTCTGPPLGQL